MTPKPPASSDGSALPPRHRPNMGNLAKDTTELDLWAFDDAEVAEDGPADPAPKAAEPEIPAPRPGTKQRDEPKQRGEDEDGVQHLPVVSSPKSSIRVNVNKNRVKDSSALERSRADAEFDDLDSWDEPETAPVDVPEEAKPVTKSSVVADPVEESPDTPEPPSRDEPQPVAKETTAGAEKPALTSLKPNLGLSKVERIGLVALVAVLLVGAGIIYVNTISRLPKGADLTVANDFPIAGQLITVNSAETYWRPPVTEGPNADTFRRDTLLLPVVSLDIGKGSGTVRVFFRDGKGEVIGDAVTRSVRGAGKLEIAATAGFEDAGMYAGYRTGLDKVWTVEVHEAAPESTTATAFRKLFEMSIGSDRR